MCHRSHRAIQRLPKQVGRCPKHRDTLIFTWDGRRGAVQVQSTGYLQTIPLTANDPHCAPIYKFLADGLRSVHRIAFVTSSSYATPKSPTNVYSSASLAPDCSSSVTYVAQGSASAQLLDCTAVDGPSYVCMMVSGTSGRNRVLPVDGDADGARRRATEDSPVHHSPKQPPS